VAVSAAEQKDEGAAGAAPSSFYNLQIYNLQIYNLQISAIRLQPSDCSRQA
jgi:hypothetical protein